ncbi:MAG TPA: KTSC domain-containing protein [Aquella sp.]|nr:KTSC domain-containing protein [Aquella sp.]
MMMKTNMRYSKLPLTVSSMFRSAYYCKDDESLIVQFPKNILYIYHNVPNQLMEDWVDFCETIPNASSGKWFDKEIKKGEFEYNKIDDSEKDWFMETYNMEKE